MDLIMMIAMPALAVLLSAAAYRAGLGDGITRGRAAAWTRASARIEAAELAARKAAAALAAVAGGTG